MPILRRDTPLPNANFPEIYLVWARAATRLARSGRIATFAEFYGDYCTARPASAIRDMSFLPTYSSFKRENKYSLLDAEAARAKTKQLEQWVNSLRQHNISLYDSFVYLVTTLPPRMLSDFNYKSERNKYTQNIET